MKRFVWVAGVAIPLLVAVMFFLPGLDVSPEMQAWLHQLPALNATINGSAFLCLLGSLWAIRRKKLVLHQRLNTTALVLSALFLLSYVSYHITTESTPFCKEGTIRVVYFFILISQKMHSQLTLSKLASCIYSLILRSIASFLSAFSGIR